MTKVYLQLGLWLLTPVFFGAALAGVSSLYQSWKLSVIREYQRGVRL